MPEEIVPPVENNPPVTVDREAHNAILKELEKQRQLNNDMRGELDTLKLNTHKDKDDWQTVAKIKEQEANDYKTKFTGLQSALINEKKLSKLQEAAVRAGINTQALPDLELLDLPEVTIQTTSNGKILVEGADLAIQNLKTLRPHWFGTQVPSINTNSPNTLPSNPNTVTYKMVEDAANAYAKSKSESDKKIYQELIYRFKAQPRA